MGGGLSSTIAGGNFWDGVRQGLITTGLNALAHGLFGQKDPGDPKGKEHPAQKAQRLAREKHQLKNISNPEKYPGIDIYQNQDPNDMTAVTLPGSGIYIGGYYNNDELTMVTQHEYGHYLQYKQTGFMTFYTKIGIPSITSTGNHRVFWTETWANRLAYKFFGNNLNSEFLNNYPLYGPNE